MCGFFGIFVYILYLYKFKVSLPILGSLIPNIVLGLLLVFRTNTAYERFWEGRKAWGLLVNTVRNLSRQMLVAIAEYNPSDRKAKVAAVKLLPAFAIALKLHLRSEPVNAELEANLWFNNNDICCGQVKEAKISLGIEGTFHLYDTNEVIFIEGEDEDPNAITSINANRLSHFIIDNIVRTPEEILLDEELYDTFVRNKHSLVEVGVFLPDTKVGEEEDWEDFINTIKIESNLSFIPLKSTAIGTPEIVKIDNKKFIKGNSLVDFYLESCNEQEFKEYLNQKSFYYLEPIDTFKDLIFAIKKLIKVEEKPKPILLNPLHKAKPKNPYYDEYR